MQGASNTLQTDPEELPVGWEQAQISNHDYCARMCICSSNLYWVPNANFVELVKSQTIEITSKHNSGGVNKVLWTKIQSRK